MLINEKITERLRNVNDVYDYFLEESKVNELIKEAEDIRFEEGYLVLKFKTNTVTLSLDEQVSIATRIDGDVLRKVYSFRIETWGGYERSAPASEQREIVFL